MNQAVSGLELLRVNYRGFYIAPHVCIASFRQSVLSTSNMTSSNVVINATGEIAGSGGATANRGSVITLDRTVIDGGNPGLNLTRYSRVEATNSVFRNQGAAGAITFGTLADNASSVRFSTFVRSTLACPSGPGSGFLASANNLFFNTGISIPADTVTGTYCSHSYDLISPQSTLPAGPGNIVNVDPKFASVPNADFHLTTGSPAIDAADPNATEAVDFDGTPRPQGGRRDIGAFEFQ